MGFSFLGGEQAKLVMNKHLYRDTMYVERERNVSLKVKIHPHRENALNISQLVCSAHKCCLYHDTYTCMLHLSQDKNLTH